MRLHEIELPLVAILRGLSPQEAPAIGAALFDAGFRLIEVPLNRPGALEAIRILAAQAPRDALVGGGTMLSVDQVSQVHDAGGSLMVAPNCSAPVIRHARGLGMQCVPGVATPTEAFQALDAGAHALKLFPAESIGPSGLKALTAVIPAASLLWPVGGITPDSMGAWIAAGANGFGLGGALYAPGAMAADVAARAGAFAAAWRGGHLA